MDNYKETFAVIGILFKIDKESHPFVESLNIIEMSHIPELNLGMLFDEPEKKTEEEGAEDTKENQQGFYHYKGSLTTPPCSDIVNWFVHKKVLPISEAHLEYLRQQWHCKLGQNNYRET